MPQKCAKVRFATSEHGLLLGDVAIIAAKYSEQTWIIIMLVEISFVFIITTHREYISSNNGYSSYEIALKLLWLVASALAVLVRQGSHKGQGKRYDVLERPPEQERVLQSFLGGMRCCQPSCSVILRDHILRHPESPQLYHVVTH